MYILVFYSSVTKYHRIRSLKTIQIYFLTVFRGQESGCELGKSHQVEIKKLTSSGPHQMLGSSSRLIHSGCRQNSVAHNSWNEVLVFLLVGGQSPSKLLGATLKSLPHDPL